MMANQKKAKVFEFRPCIDIMGRSQPHGDYYTPSSSVCSQCECDNGESINCIAVQCQTPSCKDYKQVPGKCCDYTCPNGDGLSNTKTLAVVITLSLMLFVIVVAIIVVWRKMRRKKKFGKRFDSASTSSTQEETSMDSEIQRNSIPNNTRQQQQQQQQQQRSPPICSPHSLPSCSGINKANSFDKDSFCKKNERSPSFSPRSPASNELKTKMMTQHEVVICCEGDGCCKHKTQRFEPPPPYSPPKNLTFV